MHNPPHSARNPRLPSDAAAAKNTQTGLPDAEDELEKTEAEKAEETAPEDKEPFDMDKADELKKEEDK